MMAERFAHQPDNRGSAGFRGAESGATAVEFALTAPIFLTIVYGILELARAMFTQGVLIYAVQEGSRYAAARPESPVEAIEAVVTGSIIGIDPAPVILDVTQTVNADQTRTVRVAIQYSFTWLVPLFPTNFVTLTADSSSIAG